MSDLKRFLKFSLKFLAVVLGLLILLSFGGWIYLKKHKAELISYIKTESAKRLNGEVSIGEISISLFHTFPKISISLENVTIRDSLWTRHHHDLLNAPRAFASFDFFELATGHLRIGKLILENPRIYLYTDSNGYNNTSIFKKKTPGSTVNTEPVRYPNLEMRNASLIVEKLNKHKFFSFDIHHLVCRVNTSRSEPQLNLDINLLTQVNSLTFNQEKGSFAEGKIVQGKFRIQLNPESKILQFENIRLLVDKQLFTATGKFFLAEVPALFTLTLQTDNLDFKKAANLLTANIRKKLNLYDVSHGVNSLTCTLDGTDSGYRTPLIRLLVSVRNKSVHTPLADLDHAYFEGLFTNELVRGAGHTDQNSVLRFSSVDAGWQGMDFHSDSMIIKNLIDPAIRCNLKSTFRLEHVNNLLDDETFKFTKGSGKINLLYSGPLTDGSTTLKSMTGSIALDSAAFTYLPRNFALVNGKGKIRFAADDMFIEDLHANTGTTDLTMNGSMKNIFSLIDKNASQLSLDWDIRSNRINLNDFRNFLKKRSGAVSRKKSKALFSETLYKITRLMETSSMLLNLQAREVQYKKFTATGLETALELNDDAINMKSLVLKHAGGTISAHGALRNEISSNPFSFKANLKQVNISKVLDAFNDFGQTAITAKNLQGSLDADIDLRGEVTEKAQLIPDSTRGEIHFNLLEGRLIQFEPIQKISETVFKNRNFADIQFADLHDRFVVSGNTISMDRMEIRSTVLTMFVEGQYDMKKGADLSIQIPLSNLKNKNGDVVPENKGVDSKTGVSARLRAKTGDDHKLHISWDPFNKAVRKMKKHR